MTVALIQTVAGWVFGARDPPTIFFNSSTNLQLSRTLSCRLKWICVILGIVLVDSALRSFPWRDHQRLSLSLTSIEGVG